MTTGSARVRAIAIAIAAVIFVLPLVVMVLGSLRTPGLPPARGLELVPDPVRFANYDSIFAFIPLGRQIANSLFVVAVAVPITVLVSSWAGYAIVTSSHRRARLLVVLSLMALMIPVTALWVPRFALFRSLGLTDTLWPLIAPALMGTTPFYALVFALAYSRIPRPLFEAATLEGLSPFATWRRVALPLALPAAFAVSVLAFVWHWSNFIEPLLYLSSSENFTVSLGLRHLQTLEPTNHPILLAASVVAALPPVIAFLLAQRAFFERTLEV